MKRRHFVRGAALAGLSGFVAPLARSVLQTASAQSGTDSIRFLFVTTTNGWWPWRNTTLIGDMNDDSATNDADKRDMGRRISGAPVDTRSITLPPVMAPFERHQEKMLFIDGLTQRHINVDARNSHSKGPQLFNGLGDDTETIDQYLARGLAAPRPWVGLGSSRQADRNSLIPLNSVNQSGSAVPFLTQPGPAFDSLFAGLEASSAPAERPFEPVLFDGAAAQIREAQSQLRGSERDVLDGYLDSVRHLETQLVMRETFDGSCDPGSAPSGGDTRAQWQQLYDMAATALGCGLTRTAWLCFGGGGNNNDFDMSPTQIGDIIGDAHWLHHIGHQSVPDSRAKQERYHTWHSAQIARLMDRLEAMPNGRGGTVMDDTVIVYMNDNGTFHHNTPSARHPVCLFGSAGGRIKADGRFIRYAYHPDWWAYTDRFMDPSDPDSAASVQQLWNTLSHVAGLPKDDWGIGPSSRERHRGVLEGILV